MYQKAYYVLGSLDLNTGNYVVKGFQERTPGKQTVWAGGDPARDGKSRTAVSYPNKRFTLVLSIVEQTDTTALDAALRALYEQVVRADDEKDTLWLYHRPVADTSWGEIRQIKVLNTDCRVPKDERMWKTLQLDGIELEMECEEAWRGSEVTLATETVQNTHDGTRQNYIEILGADIDGDVPALCRIECASDDAAYSCWRIAQKVDAGTIIKEYSGTVDSTASDGEYKVESSPTTAWGDVSSLSLAAGAGTYGLYRVFCRVQDRDAIGGNLYLRLTWGAAVSDGGDPISESETVNDQRRVKPWLYPGTLPGQIWVDVALGTVDFREETWKQGSYEPVYLSAKLQWKRTTGTADMWVDRLYFVPIDEGYLFVGRTEGVSAQNDKLVVDSDEGMVFVIDSSDQIQFFPSLDGGPFHLEPHPSNDIRLYFLWEEGDDPSVNVIKSGTDRGMSVVVYATPRYL